MAIPTLTGGTVTTVGQYTLHTFNANSTLTLSGPGSRVVEVFVVGGGAPGGFPSGGKSGGGGAGGEVKIGTFTISASQSITIGAAGVAGAVGVNGTPGGTSSFGALLSAAGGSIGDAGNDPGTGVNGGGARAEVTLVVTPGGVGTNKSGGSGQGATTPTSRAAGGGAGNATNGLNGGSQTGGKGGDGTPNDWTGTTLYFGAGGGGACGNGVLDNGGAGGLGQIGTDGSGGDNSSTQAGMNATGPNTGHGGGGAQGLNAGNGATGVIKVRYLTNAAYIDSNWSGNVGWVTSLVPRRTSAPSTVAQATTFAGGDVVAAINDNWGSWTATADAKTEHPATITTSWGSWTAVAVAVLDHPATISTNWSGGAPYSPNDVAGLTLWLEADVLTPGALSAWTNPGSGADAPMLGSPNPTVVAGITPTGKSVVRFVTGEGRVRMYSTGIDNDFTLVYVARMTPGAANWVGRIVNGIYSPANILFGFWNAFEDVAYDQGFASPNTQTAVTSNWHTYSADGEPALDRFFSNGTQMGTIATAQGWMDTFAISGYDPTGTSETADCDVAGVLLWNVKLADTDRQTAEQYMRAKYLGIGSLPGGIGGWAATAIGTVSAAKFGTIADNWGTWTATALATRITTGAITENWGGWVATAVATRTHFATITQSWGTWTATAQGTVIAEVISATVNSNWGTWNATAVGVRGTPATIVSLWGTWTATAQAQPIQRNAWVYSMWGSWDAQAVAQPIQRNATAVGLWGTWTATAVGTVTAEVISATIADNWGGWNATSLATRIVTAAVTENWGGWNATAVATRTHFATIATPWGGWTASAIGTVAAEVIPASIADNWGTWTATGIAQVQHPATINSPWGTWTGVAIATRITTGTITENWGGWVATAVAQPLLHPAFIATNWGTWTATAQGLVVAEVITATIADNWGTWTATAIAGLNHPATITQSWGTWTGVAQAQPIERRATVNDSWGTWNATALATRITTGSITENWGGWVATAIATRTHFVTISTPWGTWTATAQGSRGIVATINSSWGLWVPVAVATVEHPATIASMWGSWSAIAQAQPIQRNATINSPWGTWTAVAQAQAIQRNATINDSWGSWTGVAQAQPLGHPATITTNWGTWTGVAWGTQLGMQAGTIDSNWGGWTATAQAQPIFHSAVINSSWGAWTATAVVVVDHPATIGTSWGGWTATAVALTEHPATIAQSWGTWTATGLATRIVTSTVTENWGGWVATAVATRTHFVSIASPWGNWTATAQGTVIAEEISASINSPWGTWTAVAQGVLDHSATINDSWGTWTALAIGTQQGVHVATINDDWSSLGYGVPARMLADTVPQTLAGGNYTLGARFVPQVNGRVTHIRYYHYKGGYPDAVHTVGLWDTNTATLLSSATETNTPDFDGWYEVALPTPYLVQAGVNYTASYSSDSYGYVYSTPVPPSLTADLVNQGGHYAGPATFPSISAGSYHYHCDVVFEPVGAKVGWTATAQGTVIEWIDIWPALISDNWGAWTAVAQAQPLTHPALVNDSWGIWNATALATRITTATVTENWGGWVATSIATRNTQVSIADNWGTWNAVATAVRQGVATINDNWGVWTATAQGTAFGYESATINSPWGGWTGVATARADKPGTRFVVTVTGMAQTGTVIATVPANAAAAVNNGINNEPSTSTDNIVNWVKPAPSAITGQYVLPQCSDGTDPLLSGLMIDGRKAYTIESRGTPDEIWAFHLDVPGIHDGAVTVTRTQITGGTPMFSGFDSKGVATGGYMWGLITSPYRLARIDPITGVVTATVAVAYSHQILGTDSWIYNADGTNLVTRIDPSIPAIAATSPSLNGMSGFLCFDAANNALWCLSWVPGTPSKDRMLHRLHPMTMAIVGTPFQLPGTTAKALVPTVDATGTYLYAADPSNGTIYRVTIADSTVTTYPNVINVLTTNESAPCAVVGDHLYVWHTYVASAPEAMIANVDLNTMVATYITGYADPYFGADEGYHWDGVNLWLLGRNVRTGNQSDALIKLG